LRHYYEFLDRNLNPKSKEWFIRKLEPTARILDVGCGNNSPQATKSLLPNCYYVGLDVMDYNQSSVNVADQYFVVKPEQFAESISSSGQSRKFDAVISSHNLEHCNDRGKVLEAMCDSVTVGGLIFLSFPTAKSVGFPRRAGTLNYFDDQTHRDLPPDFAWVSAYLRTQGFSLDFASNRYRPRLAFLVGFFQEPVSILSRRKRSCTWALYGFESIIWARKTRL